MFETVNPLALGSPVGDGLQNIGNIIQQARARQREESLQRAKMLQAQQNLDADNARADVQMQLQRDQFAQANEDRKLGQQRQGAADFTKIHEAAGKAAGKDPELAKQLALAYGYKLGESPQPDAIDQVLSGPAPAKPAISPEVQAATTQSSGPDAITGAGPPVSAPIPSTPEAPLPERPVDPGILTARQKLQQAASGKFQLTSPSGLSLSIDPEASKRMQDAEFADQLKLKSAAPQERIAAMQLENEKKRQFQLDHPELKNQPLTFAEREKLAEINGGSRVTAARVSAAAPLKVDAGNRQDMNSLRQSFAQWRGENQLAIDSRMSKRLNTAMKNLNTDNGMQQREGAESLVGVFKGGGQVTKASQELLLRHLSGLVGDAEPWLSERANGTYGPQDLAVLREAAQGAVKENQDQAQQYLQSAADTFGPGSGWENLGANVNHMVKGEFRQFGLDAPDIYINAPTPVTLGSGERPNSNKARAAKVKAGGKPAAGADPLDAMDSWLKAKGY